MSVHADAVHAYTVHADVDTVHAGMSTDHVSLLLPTLHLSLFLRSVLDAEEKMKRDRLLAQLAEVEVEGIDLRKHAKKLKTSIRKLQKDRRFVSVDAAQVAENKDIFLGSLSQFEKSNEYLSKLVQSQEAYQTSVGQLTEHRDLLEKKLDMSESTNQLLKEKLEEQEHLAMHSQSLHNEIGQRDGEIQSLTIQLQVSSPLLKVLLYLWHCIYSQWRSSFVIETWSVLNCRVSCLE